MSMSDRKKPAVNHGNCGKEKKWNQSEARKLLFQDLSDGSIPLQASNGPTTRDIYNMRPEYSETDFSKFGRRLYDLRKKVRSMKSRAEQDQLALERYCKNHIPSATSRHGYAQYQGSQVQELLQKDIKENNCATLTHQEHWQSRPEFHKNYSLKTFRNLAYQEIRTSKYKHTLKVRGKLHKAS